MSSSAASRSLLPDEHVRSNRRLTPPDRLLAGGDLLERHAEMDRSGAAALARLPGNRAVERPVDLEDARAVAESLEFAAVAGRQAVAGDRDEFPGSDVEEDDAGGREITQGGDRGCGADLPFE